MRFFIVGIGGTFVMLLGSAVYYMAALANLPSHQDPRRGGGDHSLGPGGWASPTSH